MWKLQVIYSLTPTRVFITSAVIQWAILLRTVLRSNASATTAVSRATSPRPVLPLVPSLRSSAIRAAVLGTSRLNALI